MKTALRTYEKILFKFYTVKNLLTVVTLGPYTFRNIGGFSFRINICLVLATAA